MINKTDLKLNPYECAILSDFELYNTHAERDKIEKQSILRTKIDCVDYNRKALPTE